jgi:hypothetical protein
MFIGAKEQILHRDSKLLLEFPWPIILKSETKRNETAYGIGKCNSKNFIVPNETHSSLFCYFPPTLVNDLHLGRSYLSVANVDANL